MKYKMKREIFKNKKLGILVLIVLIFSFITITIASSESLGNNLGVNETVTQIAKSIEKITDIEVWANTLIKVGIKENIVRALLLMDNETPLSGQEIDFYLNESLIESKFTNSEGYAEISFNLYNISLGNYSFKASFPGNSSLYLNPSHTEKQIEVIDSYGTRQIRITEALLGENETAIINESLLSVQTNKLTYLINDTINIFGEILINGEKVNTKGILEIEFNKSKIFTADIEVVNGSYNYSLIANFKYEGEYLVIVSVGDLSNQISFYFSNAAELLDENVICKEFEDNILWTSGLAPSSEGSAKYQTWAPETNCTEAGGQNCFLQDIGVSSRTIYISTDDKEINGKSYIQISNPDRTVCTNPERGVYSTYLTYESIKENLEGQKSGWYCGYDKEESEDLIKFKPKCGIKFTEKLSSNSECYGIKAFASQSMLVDAFKVKYKLCWNERE